MKILIYGAGAVGGYLGVHLSETGHTVTMVVREVTADAINNNGLILTEDGKTYRAQPKALTSIAQAFAFEEDTSYDLIVMAMKAYDLPTALDHLVAFCPEPPPIITIQNGIGVETPLIEQFGAERIIAGALTTPISKDGTHRLLVERADRGLGLAPTQHKQNIKPWVRLFQKTGIPTAHLSDYRSMKWSKAMLNIVGNATSAILNRSPGAIYKTDQLFDLEIRMLREMLDVMDALNLKVVDLPGSPANRLALGVRRAPKVMLKPILTQLVAKGRGDKMPSFQIDLSSGRGQSEVIFHNGAIARAGEQAGILTPVNWTLTSVLLRLTRKEADWRDYDGNAKRLLGEIRRTRKMMRQRQREKANS